MTASHKPSFTENFENTSSFFVNKSRKRLTPPLRANLPIAGFGIPWMLSSTNLQWVWLLLCLILYLLYRALTWFWLVYAWLYSVKGQKRVIADYDLDLYGWIRSSLMIMRTSWWLWDHRDGYKIFLMVMRSSIWLWDILKGYEIFLMVMRSEVLKVNVDKSTCWLVCQQNVSLFIAVLFFWGVIFWASYPRFLLLSHF